MSVDQQAVARFTDAEYERRWSAVLEQVERQELDALIVTALVHHEWLTGHDAAGAYAAPYYLIVAPGKPRVLVSRHYDEINIRNDLRVDLDLHSYYHALDAGKACADALQRHGLENGRVGMELKWWGMSPDDVQELQALSPGLTIVDASRLVARIAEVHSDEEIGVMRRAAELTDVAIETFYAALEEGVSERAALAQIQKAIQDAGGESRFATLLFGERTRLPHGPASEYALADGDIAFVELSGYHLGYAAGVCRTAIKGRHAEAEELHEIAEEALLAGVEAMRPGNAAEEVHHATYAVVERHGRGEAMLARAGYAIGLDWFARGSLSLEPGVTEELQAGMTLHTPRILFDEQRRWGIGTSDTFLLGENGAEPLSKLPRSIRLL